MTGRSEPDGPAALTPGEYVRPLPKGGWTLSDDAVTDIAVASGWIEDTPEARAAYLAGDDTPFAAYANAAQPPRYLSTLSPLDARWGPLARNGYLDALRTLPPEQRDRLINGTWDDTNEPPPTPPFPMPVIIIAPDHRMARHIAERELHLRPHQWTHLSNTEHLRGRDGGRYYLYATPPPHLVALLRSRHMTEITDDELDTLRRQP